jgi:enamine deaminase RidA (YjgF/YER057c/UK114 family)
MSKAVKIEKKYTDNLDIVTVSTPKLKKYYITSHPEKNGCFYCLYKNLMEYIQRENAQIISQFVFGSCEHYDESIEKLEKLAGPVSWPITWLHGDSCSCGCLTGTQIMAVSGVEVSPIKLDGKIIGSVYEDDDGEYCYLGNIHTNDLSGSNADHAQRAYENMLAALKSVNMDFSNVIRMWNYLDDLLKWYDDFNVMRTVFFNKHDVFNNIIPAGTGIGAGNPSGAAYVGDLMAVRPKGDTKMFAVPSPLQCPAIDYKSSFSRAIELDMSGLRYLSISGTASIESGGKTVYLNNVPAQIEQTMKVVDAILKSRNMDWSNTVKAIAYFADIKDAPLFKKILEEKHYPQLPVAISHADICRDDLLFEIELEAVVGK